MNSNLLLTPIAAAEMLAVSRTQVYVLLNAGELKAIHLGRSMRVLRASVDDLIARRLKQEEGRHMPLPAGLASHHMRAKK